MTAEIIAIQPDIINDFKAVGVYPRQFDETLRDCGDRLQEVANRTGLTIITSDFLEQQNQTIIIGSGVHQTSVPARYNNDPDGGFPDACKRYTDALLNWLRDHGYEEYKRIGIGHSLGGVIISGMQIYGEGTDFAAIELVDSINTADVSREEFVAYQFADKHQEIDQKRNDEHSIYHEKLPKHDWSVDTVRLGKKPEEKEERMENVKFLVNGTTSVNYAIKLAKMPNLRMNVIGFKHPLGGTEESVHGFLRRLNPIRQAAAAKAGCEAAPILISMEDFWHSALKLAGVVTPFFETTINLAGGG